MKVDTGLSDTIGGFSLPTIIPAEKYSSLGKTASRFPVRGGEPAGWGAVLRARCSFTRYWLFHCGTIAAYRLAPIFPGTPEAPIDKGVLRVWEGACIWEKPRLREYLG